MINLRLPNITASTEKGQLEQIRSYLYQFAEQLNWALGNIDNKAAEATQKIQASTQQKDAVQQAQATFSEVKSLIIKSADIVNAYYDEINRRLEGQYVAQSEFGIYTEETSVTLDANAKSISLMFDNQQAITTNVTNLSSSLDTTNQNVNALSSDVDGINGVVERGEEYTTILGSEAWCKIGVLGYESSGFPIYGMEIGQVNTNNGTTASKKFAQYRSDGVHLFDQNGIEVATISDYTLRITNAVINNAEITGALKLGGYTINAENGLAFKWGGR